MGLKTWMRKILAGGEVIEEEIPFVSFFGTVAIEAYARDLAFRSAVTLIANSISKCEFRTYLNGQEKIGDEYYLWNIRPNKNQNSSEFIIDWITKLYQTNECLIVEVDGQLLVADSFQMTPYALYDNRFDGVTVDGLTFDRPFFMSDVLHYKLNDTNIRNLIDGLYNSYGKLLASAIKGYQLSRGRRGVLKLTGTGRSNTDYQAKLAELMNERFAPYFNNENAVLPLYDGFDYKDSDSKTYASESTRDIRSLVDDVFDFTARAFCIPPALLRGEVANTSWAVDNYLTFCIDPLADMLQEEIMGKRIRRADYLRGSRTIIDTKTIKHVDLLGVATSIDKLVSSSAFSVNDIRRVVGEEPINEPWADEHYMTLNYKAVVQTPDEAKRSDSNAGA